LGVAGRSLPQNHLLNPPFEFPPKSNNSDRADKLSADGECKPLIVRGCS